MRACSLVCSIGVIFLVISQFYYHLDWGQLLIGGIVVVAIWTDCERWFRYKLRRRRHN